MRYFYVLLRLYATTLLSLTVTAYGMEKEKQQGDQVVREVIRYKNARQKNYAAECHRLRAALAQQRRDFSEVKRYEGNFQEILGQVKLENKKINQRLSRAQDEINLTDYQLDEARREISRLKQGANAESYYGKCRDLRKARERIGSLTRQLGECREKSARQEEEIGRLRALGKQQKCTDLKDSIAATIIATTTIAGVFGVGRLSCGPN